MKKQVVPLPRVVIQGISLPQVIYESGGNKVTLLELSDDDIETIFGYRFKRVSANSFQYEPKRHSIADQQTIPDLAESKLQILIEAPSEPEGAELKDRVEFGMKIVLGRGNDYSAVWTEFGDDGGWGFLHSGGKTSSARRTQEATIDAEAITNMQLAITADQSTNPKILTLRALLNAAMQQPKALDVSCALFFSLLEAIYIQDANPSEKTYKLKTRVTKKLGRNYDFAEKLRKLYDKRSKVIHGTAKGGVFTQEEHQFIEQTSVESLLLYLSHPNDFSQVHLDRLLLG